MPPAAKPCQGFVDNAASSAEHGDERMAVREVVLQRNHPTAGWLTPRGEQRPQHPKQIEVEAFQIRFVHYRNPLMPLDAWTAAPDAAGRATHRSNRNAP